MIFCFTEVFFFVIIEKPLAETNAEFVNINSVMKVKVIIFFILQLYTDQLVKVYSEKNI